MKEVPVSALDAGLQKQVESARAAFERGQLDRVATACGEVLSAEPGCLPVRKLQRAARIKQGRPGRVRRMLGRLSSAPLWLSGKLALGKNPLKALAYAQRMLDVDPLSGAALRLLASAATALGWSETAIFAGEALREIEPTEVSGLVTLGRAYLSAGRAENALEVAGCALQLEPANAQAQALLKDASVAQTMRQGRWGDSGDFRGKLRQPS